MRVKGYIICLLAAAAACGKKGGDTPKDEDRYALLNGNVRYGEMMVSQTKNFWVEVEDKEGGSGFETVKWLVEGEEKGSGLTFAFSPAVAGMFHIVCEAEGTTLAQGDYLVYDTEGVWLLQMPVDAMSEAGRGVLANIFGELAVDRYITGDYTTFGTTPIYIAEWAGALFCLSEDAASGVAMSKFSVGDVPEIMATKKRYNSAVKAFAGIDEKYGVVTTDLAQVIDLTMLEGQFMLAGSAGASNVFVADDHIFLITSAGAVAYPVEGLTEYTAPTVLGAATAGFVQSKEGYVWAFNGNELLRIDPSDLSTATVTLPGGFEVKQQPYPWRQCAAAASTAEEVLFFVNDRAGDGTAQEIFRYDIAANSLDTEFVTAEDMKGYVKKGRLWFIMRRTMRSCVRR